MAFVLVVAGYLLRHRADILIIMILCASVVGYYVLEEERFQRVETLADTDSTLERVSGSAHLGILTVLGDYPFGVGLGGALGTSIPSFLAQYTPNQIGAETSTPESRSSRARSAF